MGGGGKVACDCETLHVNVGPSFNGAMDILVILLP